jgi:hypothetical protein
MGFSVGFHTVLSVTAGLQGIESAEALCTIASKVLEGEKAGGASAV